MCIISGNSFTIHIYRRKRFAYCWFDRTFNVKPQNRTLWTWAMLRNEPLPPRVENNSCIPIKESINRRTRMRQLVNERTNASLNKKETDNHGKHKTNCKKSFVFFGFYVLVKSYLSCTLFFFLFIFIFEKFRYGESIIDTWLFKKIYARFFLLPRSGCVLFLSSFFSFKYFSFEVAVCSGSFSSLVHYL